MTDTATPIPAPPASDTVASTPTVAATNQILLLLRGIFMLAAGAGMFHGLTLQTPGMEMGLETLASGLVGVGALAMGWWAQRKAKQVAHAAALASARMRTAVQPSPDAQTTTKTP